VSQDLALGVPVDRHATLKRRLGELHEFAPSADEPSVWTPRSPGVLELNLVGIDPAQDPAEAYVLEDDRLPLLAVAVRLSTDLLTAECLALVPFEIGAKGSRLGEAISTK
jgi:hypothetical protein